MRWLALAIVLVACCALLSCVAHVTRAQPLSCPPGAAQASALLQPEAAS